MGGNTPFQIGNFLGFVRVLSKEVKPRFEGDFLTSVDPDVELESSGYKDYKFGTDDLAKDVVVYAPGDTLPFEVVDPEVLPDRIIQWIRAKWLVAKPQDAVNLILIGHGSKGVKGKIKLGSKTIRYEEIIRLMKKFDKEVQVNVITTACYSGRLTDLLRASSDQPENRLVHTAASATQTSWAYPRSTSGRYRSSPFVRSWVSSLGSLSGLTLQEHKIQVLRTMGNVPPERRSNPQMYTDALLSRTMENILIRGYADIHHDSANSHRRKRVEKATSTVADVLDRVPTNAGELAASECLEHELRLTGWHEEDFVPPPIAISLFESATSVNAQRRARLLSLLYFRARKQSAIFDTFMQLELMDIVSLDSLLIPVNIDDNSDEAVNWVFDALGCFDVSKQLASHPQHAIPAGVDPMYELPSMWLAIMLVRSCKDLLLAFEAIWQSNYLGELDLRELAQYRRKKLVNNPRACEGASGPAQHFCFLLPSGIKIAKSDVLDVADLTHTTLQGSRRQIINDAFETRFNRLEEAFKDLYGLKDEDLARREDEPVPKEEDLNFSID
ncbi:MAG: hypothetical protein M1817_002247 [Caeruleum heppii]|nr:MAG: hypothetical protein M1817_002247 [Caeruleum heppii]